MRVFEYVLKSPLPKLTEAIVVNESCLVLPDVEIPYHNSHFINQCIKEAKARKIKALVLPGDFAHWSALAHFPAAEKDLEQELALMEDLVGGFLRPFERIYYCKGNHDARLENSLDRFVPLKYMARLWLDSDTSKEWDAKVRLSDKYWLWVGEGENRWRVSHPKATNIVPANAARRMAEKFNSNFAMAHDHLVGIQQTQDGRHYGAEIGCCVDPERLAYVQNRDMTRPLMKCGAMLLEKHGEEFTPTILAEGLFWFK